MQHLNKPNKNNIMKQTTNLLKSFLVAILMVFSLPGNAQRYEVDHGRVFYGEELVRHADVRSFIDLGFGYAKDNHNVYMNGRVLENVDPTTFRLKERPGHRPQDYEMEDRGPHRGYFKTTFNVYYGNKKIDAMASTFKEIGNGYAKDSFNVFYYGEKIEGATASSFKELGGGYSKDSFNVYYYGQKVEGAMASSFKYIGNGYGQDSFNAFYRGQKLK